MQGDERHFVLSLPQISLFTEARGRWLPLYPERDSNFMAYAAPALQFTAQNTVDCSGVEAARKGPTSNAHSFGLKSRLHIHGSVGHSAPTSIKFTLIGVNEYV